MNKLLPVGSVIKINNNNKKYIILGRNITYNNNKYDYMCLLYPSGYYNYCKFEYFNDSDAKYEKYQIFINKLHLIIIIFNILNSIINYYYIIEIRYEMNVFFTEYIILIK